MKQIEVTIMGQSYLLGCPDGGETSLQAAVASVDREMCAIRDAGRVKARERIAVLAALNLAFQLAEKGRETTQRAPALGGEAGEARLAQLVQRLDEALNDDGRLL
ncbi:cell division protein ZapA [Aquabacterium sp. J223]|uniref:cell division protein ZapA n=1 Tax=Aquabacterium sp. J223 TaxID=2898431 RepID=UPI0021AD50E6|nr:cell division protein ZapA [Aquabacterium sp. J223]UUX97638.1 cell division protein ZapA [Aquabacterium sp. J223]